MTRPDDTSADLRDLLAELRQQRQRVAGILAAEDAVEASTASRPPTDADAAARRQFWTRRFEAARNHGDDHGAR